jgi:hypothetical protein
MAGASDCRIIGPKLPVVVIDISNLSFEIDIDM